MTQEGYRTFNVEKVMLKILQVQEGTFLWVFPTILLLRQSVYFIEFYNVF